MTPQEKERYETNLREILVKMMFGKTNDISTVIAESEVMFEYIVNGSKN